mgnify:FL=1
MKKTLTLICAFCLNTFVFAQTQMTWFSDINICETEDSIINFPTGDYSLYSFNWFFDGDSLTTDSSISIQNTGIYSLELYGTDTLIGNFEAIVDIVDNEFMLTLTDSELNVDSLINICLEDNPTLITNQVDYTHTWFLDGLSIGDDTLTERTLVIEEIIDEINFNQEYEYFVEVETACGIYPSKNAVTMIVNECHCALDMPNVYTPNGDEFNNEFKPINNHELETEPENICESTNFTMEIYSQWGRHITTVNSGDNYPSWDGLNKRGREVPEGVYFYQIDYKVNIYTLPQQKQIAGFFHLYR